MDAAIYHVARAGEILGEFSAEEFRRQRSAGEIKPTDHFWTEGMSEWQEVSKWKQIIAATVKMIPAPPTQKRTPMVPNQETPKPGAAIVGLLLLLLQRYRFPSFSAPDHSQHRQRHRRKRNRLSRPYGQKQAEDLLSYSKVNLRSSRRAVRTFTWENALSFKSPRSSFRSHLQPNITS